MECTYHIFILCKIHTCFSAYTAVYLSQKSRWNLDKVNTTQIGGSSS